MVLSAEDTQPKCALSATVVTTRQITGLERGTRAKISHDSGENHHGCGLLIWLALPIRHLDGRNMKQILPVCEIPLVAALPKLAALRAAKQVEPQLGILRNLRKTLANLWRLLDAPRDALTVQLNRRIFCAIAGHGA